MSLLYLIIALIVVVAVARLFNTNARVPENVKPLGNLVLALIGVGMLLWLINTYVPMAESIKTLLNVVVVLGSCVFVLQTIGLWDQAVKMSTSLWARLTRPSSKPPENPKPSEQH
jgi:predicted membrane protein